MLSKISITTWDIWHLLLRDHAHAYLYDRLQSIYPLQFLGRKRQAANEHTAWQSTREALPIIPQVNFNYPSTFLLSILGLRFKLPLVWVFLCLWFWPMERGAFLLSEHSITWCLFWRRSRFQHWKVSKKCIFTVKLVGKYEKDDIICESEWCLLTRSSSSCFPILSSALYNSFENEFICITV